MNKYKRKCAVFEEEAPSDGELEGSREELQDDSFLEEEAPSEE